MKKNLYLLFLLAFTHIEASEFVTIEDELASRQIFEGEHEIQQASSYVLAKCAGLFRLMSDEEGDYWHKASNAFSVGSFFESFPEGFENLLLSEEEKTELYQVHRNQINSYAEEYSKVLISVDPNNFEGRPPVFQKVDEDINFCLEITDYEVFEYWLSLFI